MSARVVGRVLEHSEARGAARMALVVLADRANDEGYCWPSLRWISERTRTTPRNARAAIARLERDGEVYTMPRARETDGGQTSHCYFLPRYASVGALRDYLGSGGPYSRWMQEVLDRIGHPLSKSTPPHDDSDRGPLSESTSQDPSCDPSTETDSGQDGEEDYDSVVAGVLGLDLGTGEETDDARRQRCVAEIRGLMKRRFPGQWKASKTAMEDLVDELLADGHEPDFLVSSLSGFLDACVLDIAQGYLPARNVPARWSAHLATMSPQQVPDGLTEPWVRWEGGRPRLVLASILVANGHLPEGAAEIGGEKHWPEEYRRAASAVREWRGG